MRSSEVSAPAPSAGRIATAAASSQRPLRIGSGQRMRRSPRGSGRSDANPARRRALSALCALCGMALAASCASAPAPLAAPVRPPPPPGSLRVELVFGAGADLDLYLTDPSQETVYYANSPSRVNGGRLEADLRCEAAPPRVETIVFAGAPPGRYRVGVDRAETCSGGGAVEPV